jgi:acetyl-CoA carboxylase biotin carboxyl carrier protein
MLFEGGTTATALATASYPTGAELFSWASCGLTIGGTATPMVGVAPAVASQPVVAAPAQTAPAAEPADETSGLEIISSPIVGTFYRAPGPDKDSFVKEGSKVSPDSVVCIVEAMKLMNEIQAEVSGEIVKIFVENGQPVEYGQPLFGVKK